MIITIKNLQQQTFTIDFDPKKTVLELKQKIHNERGPEYLVEKQKLIYAGVILDNERTITSYKVDDKKFIVVMLTRDVGGGNAASYVSNAAAQQKDVETTKSNSAKDLRQATSSTTTVSEVKESSQTTAAKAGVVETPVEQKAPGKSSENQTTTTSGSATVTSQVSSQSNYTSNDLIGELANASLQSRAESNLLMGEEYNQTVESMVEMGYDRAQVEQAMAASFNNPERAVEYLINGIPEDDDATFNAEPPSNAGADGRTSSRTGTNASETPSDSDVTTDPFEFLRSQPQFLQMRSLVYQNPDLLQAVLQQIGQTNPALLQLISENQDAFLNMLNQPLEGESGNETQQNLRFPANPRRTGSAESTVTDTQLSQAQRVAAGVAPIATERELEPAAAVAAGQERNAQAETVATLHLSSQDQDAIERLKALGFPEALVLQAYFACEKDEQMAANFLISSAFDD